MLTCELTVNQITGFIVGIIALIISIILLRYYLNTKYRDYLLFCAFFFSAFIVLTFDPIAGMTNNLLFYQIHHIAIDLAVFFIVLHALRVRWESPPVLLLAIGVLWFAILFILTMLWQPFEQPAVAKVIFMELPHSFSSYYPCGAGLSLSDGTIIYSTGFRYLGELYRVLGIFLIIYSYSTMKLREDSSKFRRAKRIWIVIWIFYGLHGISLFPWLAITDIVSIFLMGAAGYQVYILLRLPEYLLLSQTQSTRLMNMYTHIEHLEAEKENFENWFFKDEESILEFKKELSKHLD